MGTLGWVCKSGAWVDCRGEDRGMEEEGKGRLAFTLLLIYETTTASAGRLRSQTSRLLSYRLCFSACWCLLVFSLLLTLSFTLCGFISQKTKWGGLGLGGSVHKEAHPRFPCFIQPFFKSTDAGSIYYPLVQLIPSINHSI